MKTMIKLKPKYKQTHSSFQISSAAKSFIKDLLVRTPERRLGSGMNGFQNVKSHDFFKGYGKMTEKCTNSEKNDVVFQNDLFRHVLFRKMVTTM